MKLKEDLVLKPDDWSIDEWKIVCKVFGLKGYFIDKIVIPSGTEIQERIKEESEKMYRRYYGNNGNILEFIKYEEM